MAALVTVAAGGSSFPAALMAPCVSPWVKHVWLKPRTTTATPSVLEVDRLKPAHAHRLEVLFLPTDGCLGLSHPCHPAEGAGHKLTAAFCVPCTESPASLCLLEMLLKLV